MSGEPTPDPTTDLVKSEVWRRMLTGSDPSLPRLRGLWGRLPSAPRCKLMVLFLPVVAGPYHALRAIEAGEALLEAVADPELVGGGVQVGAGIHTGEAFVGAIGAAERIDFTALGDTVNVAARLGGDAGAGELLVSDATWRAAGRDDSVERRSLTLKGRADPLDVVVFHTKATRALA